MVTTPGVNYVKGQVVLDECYVGLLGVQVTNTETNAWGGSIEYSVDGENFELLGSASISNTD